MAPLSQINSRLPSGYWVLDVSTGLRELAMGNLSDRLKLRKKRGEVRIFELPKKR